MNSFGINDNVIIVIIVLVASVLLGGSFWGGFHVARKMVENPVALIFLTLLFGSIITVVVVAGLVAGCYALA